METNRRDYLGFSLSLMAAVLVFFFLSFILFEVLRQGLGAMSIDFLLDAPESAGRKGGILPILQSTALIIIVCFSLVLPLGTTTAYVMHEYLPYGSRLGKVVSLSLDLLAGMPSIVFGLFGMFFFGDILGFGFSILSGGLTLALMVLPFYTRSVEDGFRLVPKSYRRAAKALALSRFRSFLCVVLPCSIPSLVLGFILGVSRALAETAALLFTSGYVSRAPESLFDSGRALSVHIYDLAMNVPGGDKAAYGSVLVLMALLLIIFQVTRFLGANWRRHLFGG